MKTIPLFRPVGLLLGKVVLAAVLIASAPQVHSGVPVLDSAAARERMEAVREEVSNVRSNIYLTLVELDRVRRERDPKTPKYGAFTNQLAVMEQVCKAFGTRAEEMKKNGVAWFADSAARISAIQDSTVRRVAEQRYAERKASYEAIIENMQLARKDFTEFYEHVNEMKGLLFGTQERAMRDLFMRANWRCVDTQRALMTMEIEFDRLGDSFEKEANGSQP